MWHTSLSKNAWTSIRWSSGNLTIVIDLCVISNIYSCFLSHSVSTTAVLVRYFCKQEEGDPATNTPLIRHWTPVWRDSLFPPKSQPPQLFIYCPSACVGLTRGAAWRGPCHVSCSSNRCHADPRLHCHIHSAHSSPFVYRVTNDKEPGSLVTFCTGTGVRLCVKLRAGDIRRLWVCFCSIWVSQQHWWIEDRTMGAKY